MINNANYVISDSRAKAPSPYFQLPSLGFISLSNYLNSLYELLRTCVFKELVYVSTQLSATGSKSFKPNGITYFDCRGLPG